MSTVEAFIEEKLQLKKDAGSAISELIQDAKKINFNFNMDHPDPAYSFKYEVLRTIYARGMMSSLYDSATFENRTSLEDRKIFFRTLLDRVRVGTCKQPKQGDLTWGQQIYNLMYTPAKKRERPDFSSHWKEDNHLYLLDSFFDQLYISVNHVVNLHTWSNQASVNHQRQHADTVNPFPLPVPPSTWKDSHPRTPVRDNRPHGDTRPHGDKRPYSEITHSSNYNPPKQPER
jgi:hypothetical protein